jgi:hypothetical protein
MWDGLRSGHLVDELQRLNDRGGRRGRLGCSISAWHERRGEARDSTTAQVGVAPRRDGHS